MEGIYCSEACSIEYAACVTCGKFFKKTEAFHEHYCSAPCAVQYRLFRVYGDDHPLHVEEDQSLMVS